MKTIFSFTFSVDGVDAHTDTTSYYEYALKQKRKAIVSAISKHTGILPAKLEVTYEGGIDCWFGPGSVMLYELGLVVRITHGPEDACTVSILKP
jgi:hypothetical protein